MKETFCCEVLDHDWRYNFPSIPNKAICKRCKSKIKLDLHLLVWNEVNEFEGEKRTDDELIEKWVS